MFHDCVVTRQHVGSVHVDFATFRRGLRQIQFHSRRGPRIEQAENLTVQPLGNSEVKGMPLPPPVVSPTILTLSSDFMMDTKLFVALKEERLVRTTTGFKNFMRVSSAGSK